ncbi:Rfb, partial [Pasteurella multocida subsp. multocida str. Anand1_cattle]
MVFLMFTWILAQPWHYTLYRKSTLNYKSPKIRIVVYGAGASGQQIISALQRSCE